MTTTHNITQHNRKCVVCGSSKSTEKYDQPMESIAGIGDIDYHHKIQVCNDCGFVFVSPILDEKTILSYYETFSNYEHPQYDGKRPQVELNQIHRYFNLIKKRFKNDFKGNAADIGCATAFGLSLFKQDGWDVLGLDPSQKCVELSKKLYDVSVEQCFFDMDVLKRYQKFDLVIFCHVFEHLINPDVVASSLREIISKDGIVYIEVPNLQKPAAPKCYFSFEHVNYFTPTSLTNLMVENGFKLDHMELFDNGSDISPYYPVIASTWKMSSSKGELSNNYDEAVIIIDNFKREASDLIEKVQLIIDSVVKEAPVERIALWGAGIHTSQLLSETSLGNQQIGCIFDNDPKKHGTMVGGNSIVNFDGNIEKLKLSIDAIIISSEASENIIFDQIKHFQNYGIKVVKLYS